MGWLMPMINIDVSLNHKQGDNSLCRALALAAVLLPSLRERRSEDCERPEGSLDFHTNRRQGIAPAIPKLNLIYQTGIFQLTEIASQSLALTPSIAASSAL